MPQQPVTPSPHRFIIKKRPIEPPKPTPLKEVHSSQQPVQTPASQTQFKATPRFKFGSTQAKNKRSDVTPSQQRWPSVPVRYENAREDIADSDVPVQVNQIDSAIDVVPSSSNPDLTYYQHHDHHDMIETPLPKRRRLALDPVESFEEEAEDHHELNEYNENTNDDHHDRNEEQHNYQPQPEYDEAKDFEDLLTTHPPRITSSRPRFLMPSSTLRPTSTSTPHNRATPAFVLPREPSSTPVPDEPQFVAPPRFRPIAEPELEPREPLPAAFSPRKRGQKFIIGGLANEVRGWLIDLETHSGSVGFKKEDTKYGLKLTVHGVSGGKGCFTSVIGEQVSGREVRMILGERGLGDDLQRSKESERGDTIGVKPPIWEVELEGQKYGVCASWSVLG